MRNIEQVTEAVCKVDTGKRIWFFKSDGENITGVDGYGDIARERLSYKFLHQHGFVIPYNRHYNGKLFIMEAMGEPFEANLDSEVAWDLMMLYFQKQREQGIEVSIKDSNILRQEIDELSGRIRRFILEAKSRRFIDDDFFRIASTFADEVLSIESMLMIPSHGDLHPGNIFFEESGVMLIDPLNARMSPHSVDLNKYFGWFLVFHNQYKEVDVGLPQVQNKVAHAPVCFGKIIEQLSEAERLHLQGQLFCNLFRTKLGYYNPKNRERVGPNVEAHFSLAKSVVRDGLDVLLFI